MSNYRPAILEIKYDAAHNPIAVVGHGETVLPTGGVVSRVVPYTLLAADKTNLNAVLTAIKNSAGL
jgi:hypothetical protein